MKNYFILIILLSFVEFTDAQAILIEYSYITFRNNKGAKAFTFSNDQENTFMIGDGKKGEYGYKDVLANPDLLNPYYLYSYDKTNDTFYQALPYFFTTVPEFDSKFAADKVGALNWVISGDKKTILGYECTKATAEFRGRKWEVWFTTALNAEAFPWKLHGLPGVILEARDSEKLFLFIAERISVNSEYDIVPGVKKFFSKNRTDAVDYKTLIEHQNRGLMELQSQQLSKYPSGTQFQGIPHFRSGEFERSHEWENSKKK